MIEKLSVKLACQILIGVSSCLILFHLANMLGLVPRNITWLGQIEAGWKKFVMGIVSILLNVVVLLCAVVKGGYWNTAAIRSVVEKILPLIFWWLVGNTIANLFAKSTLEVVVFTPILVVLTVCMYRLKIQNDADRLPGR